jgi:hypothetical protein
VNVFQLVSNNLVHLVHLGASEDVSDEKIKARTCQAGASGNNHMLPHHLNINLTDLIHSHTHSLNLKLGLATVNGHMDINTEDIRLRR